MTKIEAINLSNFDNNTHYHFMVYFSELVSTYPASMLGLEDLYGNFSNNLKAEDLALRIEEGSTVSKTLEHLDQLRDKTWNAINMRIKATLLSPLEEESQSAKVLERVLQFYGDISSLNYYEQSSALTNLSNDLLLPENELHIDRVGFPVWVIELKRLNEQFQTIYNEQTTEFAGRKSDDVKSVRILIDPIYNQLIEKMNASIVLEFARPEVITFINKLNEKIKQVQSILNIRNSLSQVKEIKKEEV
jgi:hypothetical protein